MVLGAIRVSQEVVNIDWHGIQVVEITLSWVVNLTLWKTMLGVGLNQISKAVVKAPKQVWGHIP